MLDVCLKIHIDTGYQGRDTMLAEADKFYGNITRPIVVLFLNYSTEYQLKRVNIKNNCIIDVFQIILLEKAVNFNKKVKIFKSLLIGIL